MLSKLNAENTKYEYTETDTEYVFTFRVSKEPVVKYKDIIVLLDPGHGGVIDGEYQTKGKRSPNTWGPVYYEGEGNRDIVKRIEKGLKDAGIKYLNVVPETGEDVSLTFRTDTANSVHTEGKDTIYVSVHSNAGGGTGFEAYTYSERGPSQGYAQVFYDEFKKEFPDKRLRYDQDTGKPKTRNFAVLRQTAMPAILTESLFMDTESDYYILMSEERRQRIANFHIEAIKKILAI